MKTSYITNLILLCILGLLYWFNIQTPAGDSATTSLSQVSPKSIAKIIISQANRQDIVIIKHAETWQISQPLQANANPTRINLLLSLLTLHTNRQHPLSDPQSLEQFGFDDNSARLQLDDQLFVFGNIESINQQRYLLHNKTVYLVEDTIRPLLNTSASSFIDNRLFTNQNMTKLTLPSYQAQGMVRKTHSLHLTNGHWTSQPEHSADTLVSLIDAWQHAYALQVIPLEAIASKLEPLIGQTASIWFDDALKPLQLTLYLSDNALFIIHAERGLAYQFPRALYQQLLLPTMTNDA